MSRQDILRIFEGPEFGAAGSDARFPQTLTEIGVNPRVRSALDGRDILTFSVPDTAQMRDLITARKVVRLTPDGEDTSEWLVSRTSQTAGPQGAGMMLVECDPLRVVLADAGILEFVETGGQSYANLGGVNGSVRNFLATFVIPHLTRRGYSWIEIGTIDSTVQFSFSWDSFTATQLIEALAREVGAEWRLRRDEANDRYLIDVVDRISGVIADVEAKEGLNILTLVRQRNRERLFTSIRPSGQLAEGEQERGNIGLNTWRVTAVSGDNITISPIQGGFGAILEDGQHVGLYVEAENRNFYEIEGSVESSQTLELESGAGTNFAAGDDVMIVADDQGTLMTSIQSPSGISAFGFSQGSSQSKHLGHRNWIKDPINDPADISPSVYTGRLNGSPSAAMSFDGLPPNTAIPAGSHAYCPNLRLVRVQVGGTTDGSGAVNLTLSDTPGGADNNGIVFFVGSDLVPDGWSRTIDRAMFLPVEPDDEINTTGLLNGAASASNSISMDGLPPGLVLQVGTAIVSTNRHWILEKATVNGSGQVDLKVAPSVTAGDNTSYVVRRPRLLRGGLGMMVTEFFSAEHVKTPISWVQRGPFTASCTFTAWIAETPSTNANWNLSGMGFETTGPIVSIVGEFSSAQATIDFDAPYVAYTRTLQVTGSPSTGAYDYRILLPRTANVSGPSSFGSPQSFWVLNGTQVNDGSTVKPFVKGSEATRIFQDGQIALLASRQWPATYTARLSEIVSEWGLDPYSPALALGSFIRVRSPSLGIDTILRIVAIEYDPTDPGDKTFVLDTDPERISTLTARARPRPVFVDVNVEVVDNRVRETILVDESPPVVAPGAERFVVPTGTTAPTTDIPLAVTPIPDDTSLIL
jgi:hypothetical protein